MTATAGEREKKRGMRQREKASKRSKSEHPSPSSQQLSLLLTLHRLLSLSILYSTPACSPNVKQKIVQRCALQKHKISDRSLSISIAATTISLYHSKLFSLYQLYTKNLYAVPSRFFDKCSSEEPTESSRIELRVDGGYRRGIYLQRFISVLELLPDVVVLENVDDAEVERHLPNLTRSLIHRLSSHIPSQSIQLPADSHFRKIRVLSQANNPRMQRR